MCIRDSSIIEQILENAKWAPTHGLNEPWRFVVFSGNSRQQLSDFLTGWYISCLLYTSDAADERSSVDLGGRRIIKKKKQEKTKKKKQKIEKKTEKKTKHQRVTK